MTPWIYMIYMIPQIWTTDSLLHNLYISGKHLYTW